jgi:hypothetical protein
MYFFPVLGMCTEKMDFLRILNNVFRVNLRKVLKKHELVVDCEVIFDRFQVTYLRKRETNKIQLLVLKYYFRTC